MSKNEYKAPQGSDSEFVDEILAEARQMRGHENEELDDKEIPLAQARPVGKMYERPKKLADPIPQQKPVVNPPTPEMAPSPISPEMPQQPAPQPGSNVVDQYNNNQDKKKKKKRLGKKSKEEVTAGQDDIYFGLKLKTVEEVKAQRREELNKEGYTGSGELKASSPTSTFAHLFEDNGPDTSPEFEEKFRQLHLERQQRVQEAAKEAGAEVEDVFSLYEEPFEMEHTFTGLEIPKTEAPEKIVEKMVSEEFSEPETPAPKRDYHKASLEELYEEDLKAEQQSAELRLLIDEVLAKETIVEVDPPLHTESIFGLVAKERAQDTVDAEIAEEEAAKKHAEKEAAKPNIPEELKVEIEPEVTAETTEQVEEQAEEQIAEPVAAIRVQEELEHLDAEIAENVEETSAAQQVEPEIIAEETEAVIEESIVQEEVKEQAVEEVTAEQEVAEESTVQEPVEKVKEQEVTSETELQQEPEEPAKEQVAAAEIVEEKDIDLVTDPVQYVFHARPTRTFAIAGIGDVLAQQAKDFITFLHPPVVEEPKVQDSKLIEQSKDVEPKMEEKPQPKVETVVQQPAITEEQPKEKIAPKAKEKVTENVKKIKEPAKKVAGPRVINTSRFQIIDKTGERSPIEESVVEHMEPHEDQKEQQIEQPSKVEAIKEQPAAEIKEQPAVEVEKQPIVPVAEKIAPSVDQNTKIVNIQDIKEQQAKAQPAFDLNEMEPEPEFIPKQKRSFFGKNKMHILTDVEDEDEDMPEEVVEDEPELEDFTSKEDARSIAGELRKNIRTLFLRSGVTAICTAVLLILGFFAEFHIFGADISPVAYAVTNLVFLAIAIGFCATTIFHGLKALVKLRANADSAIAIATVVVAVQSIVLLFMQDALGSGNVHVYSCLITGGLLMNTLGKLSMVRRIKKNFSFVASNADKNTVELLENAEIAAQMAKDCVAGVPVVAYQKKSKFFGNFLKNSYAQDCSELTSQVIAPLGFISSLVLFIVSMIISKDVGVAFTAFAAAMCICVPMANMLCVHLPVSRLCKLARKNGGMLVGYEAVDKFADTNAVMIDAEDLFPKETVELKGIKTFGDQRIDKVLLDAASLMSQVGGPLSEVFLEVVKNHEDILPHVENVAYEDECGVIGWVSGRRILVGNRDLMNNYSVDVPAVTINKQQDQQIVYLAAGNEVVGAFILAYHVSPEKKLEMQRMARNGIGIIVKTTDPSVTAEFISDQFGIDLHSITVLSGPLVHTYEELTGKEEEMSNAMFATKGKATCMMRVITACVREKSNISIVSLLQNISIVLGFVLVAFLVCFSGLKQISTLAMFIYQIFWIIVLLVLPKIRRS